MSEVFQIGSIPLAVRSLDASALHGVERPFVALLPALDLTRLPATMQLVIPLLQAGCTNLILAGPRADAFQEQIGFVLRQEGSSAQSSSLVEIGDACNAALLAALISKAGVALCADEPELLATLRGVAEMNGWTRGEQPAAPPPAIAAPPVAAVAQAKPAAKQPAPAKKPAPKKQAAAKKPAAKKKPAPKKKPAAKKKKQR